MFGILSKEKKRAKEAELLILLMHSYSTACVHEICKRLDAGPFDQQVRDLIETDDSYQFWYTVALGLSFARGFGEDMAILVGIRTLMEFLDVRDDTAIDRGMALYRSGEDKVNQKIIDRNSKVQCASATVVVNLENENRPTAIAISHFVTFISKLDGPGMSFDEFDRMYGEEYYQ